MAKRNDYIRWDQYFMGLALLSASRSKDPSTQVGACIVKNLKVIGLGYNGLPNGMDDDNFSWSKDGSFLETKYATVVHAEANCIMNTIGYEKLQDATMYVTLFPCNECAKLIVQSGISNIIYLNDKHNKTDSNIISKKIFDYSGVNYLKMSVGSATKNWLLDFINGVAVPQNR